MKQIGFIILTSFLLLQNTRAQSDAYVQQGEFGITAGVANYFGDINTRSSFKRVKPAIGVYYKKQFNNYLGMRISAHYAQLGFSDAYSKNDFQKTRNLSFNTNIFEFAIAGDFNFFRFIPGDLDYAFTPYITLGVGMFTYNPYAYLNGQKVYLRPLGTEGQNVHYLGRKPYNSMSVCFPIGGGLKFNISKNTNFSIQVAHRLTMTDYIDDVSTTYAPLSSFVSLPGFASNAFILQDRSPEAGKGPINDGIVIGRQRGWNKQKDQYLIAELGISFNISTYRCPGSD